ncbi:hypothetical protein [Pimelobacter sp. 30-1]|uniref:hypothetical protein n=1 Tax=Pimelobacter sp. 30-1 TaxID=2004991 RepID=UPI001C05A1C5|nr:hypothetical protein [Pimelobacter sp. 30-1]MBU2694659.1 hypothetical protein [Pimelobacter sp. 30-1]
MRSRSSSRFSSLLGHRALVAVCLAAVVSLLLSTPSSSAPGDGQGDLPSTNPPFNGGGQGVVTSTQGTVVTRSKMYITIKPETPIWAVLYLSLFNTPVDNPTVYQALCARGRPCVADPFFQPDCATNDITTQRRGPYIRNLMYPVTRLPGGGVDVGKLAEVPIRMVAFGAIPATATLVLRAPRVNGKVKPFMIHIWGVSTGSEGCDLAYSNAMPKVSTLAEGKVEISIKDLKVDGRPVDLGPSCRTVRPADLQLWGESGAVGGYSPGGGGDLGSYDGLHVGSRGPLNSPYYFEDNGRVIKPSTGLEVPPFAGCGTKGENLSPLITAMASGPNNPVRVVQGPLVSHGDIDVDNLDICLNLCPLPAPPTPVRPPIPND